MFFSPKSADVHIWKTYLSLIQNMSALDKPPSRLRALLWTVPYLQKHRNVKKKVGVEVSNKPLPSIGRSRFAFYLIKSYRVQQLQPQSTRITTWTYRWIQLERNTTWTVPLKGVGKLSTIKNCRIYYICSKTRLTENVSKFSIRYLKFIWCFVFAYVFKVYKIRLVTALDPSDMRMSAFQRYY